MSVSEFDLSNKIATFRETLFVLVIDSKSTKLMYEQSLTKLFSKTI